MTGTNPAESGEWKEGDCVLVLLFDGLPSIAADSLRQGMRGLHEVPPDSIAVEMLANEEAGLFGRVTFASHRIKLIGIQAPYPDLASILQPAHLRPDQKQSLAAHQTHVICYYEGASDSGVEQFIALYSLAYGLRGMGMRGVANPITWMCLASEMLPDVMAPEFLATFRESPAGSMALWLGFVKFFRPDNRVWFALKGAPVFGVPDLAYLGASLAETDAAYDMFGTIFTYVFQSGAQIAAGHTIQIGAETFLRFRNVWEYADYLGPDTLVIEKISAADVNRPGGG